ncbi:MAG: PIN domain nuclease [Nitrococcus sp.]|nr:PIN domain nuclease [Nitrococcus sp.]
MYLIDTSVWIDLFRQRDTGPAKMLRALLDRRLPYGITSVIYQEVLQGASSEHDFRRLRDYLGTQRFYHPTDLVRSYVEAAHLYVRCRQQGITIRSTIDCLIARIAIEHKLLLLHNDNDYLQLAKIEPQLQLATTGLAP